MQIRKTYREISPYLLYDGIRDLVLKQGLVPGESKFKSYATPGNSSVFAYKGVLVFNQAMTGTSGGQVLSVQLVGSDGYETKVIFDIDELLFPAEKVAVFTGDLDFIFGSCEVNGA